MSEQESVVPLGRLLANHGSISKSDREIVCEAGSDLAGSSCLLIGSVEPPVVYGGEAEAPKAEGQAEDEGDNVEVDGGHRAGRRVDLGDFPYLARQLSVFVIGNNDYGVGRLILS